MRRLCCICSDQTRWIASAQSSSSTARPLASVPIQRENMVLLLSTANHGLRYGGRMATMIVDANVQAADSQANIRAGRAWGPCWATCSMKKADAIFETPTGIT